MASIPPAILTPALTAAMQVSTAHIDGGTADPLIVPSDGEVGAGAHVAIMVGDADAVDVYGQLASHGWRVITALHNGNADLSAMLWART